MAALPEQDTPGDSPAIDPAPYVQAYGSGYSYQDVADHHDAMGMPAPPRADLSDIWAGSSAMDAGWSQPIEPQSPDLSGKQQDPLNPQIDPDDAANIVGGAVGSIERVAVRDLVATAVEEPIGVASALSRGEQIIQDAAQTVIDVAGSTTAKVVGGAAAGEAVLMGGLPGERKKKAKANE